MNNEQILSELQKIFRDVFDDENILITSLTTSEDIEEWDSLNNIQLIVAIEKHFKIKFLNNEIQSWKNISEMIQSISSKLN